MQVWLAIAAHVRSLPEQAAARTARPKTTQTGGTYLCTDMACSLYLRGKKPVVGLGGRFKERLTLAEKIERTMANLAAFVAKVTS